MEFLNSLRLTPSAWAIGPTPTVRNGALTALSAWFLLAWSRLGLQGLGAPRAGVRFILIGFYAWLALAALTWLAGRLLHQWQAVEEPGIGPLDPTRAVELTGVAHRPLLVFAVILQVLGLFRGPTGPGSILALVAALWMAVTLGAAVAWVMRRPLAIGLATAAVPFAIWMAAVGQYLSVQIGHLL